MNAPRTFVDREEAGWLLATRLQREPLEHPLVLAIPRGGMEVAAAIARGLNAELDVVLSRKLRCPHQPELALGAVSENGEVYLNRFTAAMTEIDDASLEQERLYQLAEIARRRKIFRSVRPAASVTGRSVIITDDGVATGATMIAAIRTVREGRPREIIVAVPVGSPDRIDVIRPMCDRMLCLSEPADFFAVGQYYRSFDEVTDERVVELLREYAVPSDERASSRVVTP